MSAPPKVDTHLDIDGLAAHLGLPRTWVRDKVTARQIPHRRYGRHVRFAPEDVEAIERGGFVPAQAAPRRDEVTNRRGSKR